MKIRSGNRPFSLDSKEAEMSEVVEASRIADMKRRMNQEFIHKAHRLCPTLAEETVKPQTLVTIRKDANCNI